MNNISEATKELWRDSSPSFLRRVISMRAQKVKLISAMKFIIFLGLHKFFLLCDFTFHPKGFKAVRET